MPDWSTPIDALRQSKRDAAADNATARKERQKLHAAIISIRLRLEAWPPLPIANPCPTKGCGRMPWQHVEGDIFPCSPAMQWVPAIRSHGHKALCAAVRELERR